MKLAIVGAGPRGLLILERLIAWQQNHYPLTSVDITLYDPFPIGGRVWVTDQPHELIMNTASQQITLFYDNSVETNGPLAPGPSLAEWAQRYAVDYIQTIDVPHAQSFIDEAKHLGPNDYASRPLYGIYIQWVYEELLRRKSANVSVDFVQTPVDSIERHSDKYTVTTNAGSSVVDFAVMALGNIENTPTRDQLNLMEYAQANHRLYMQPGFPGEGDLSGLTKDDTVVLRGLGLSFFDFMARLTQGRGGTFTENDDQTLTYHATGKEPKIVAGSRRGMPYRAKGRNQKGPGEEWQPHFLTDSQIKRFKASGHITGQDFWTPLQHEVEYIYYTLLIEADYPDVPLDQFQLDFLADPDNSLAQYPIKQEDRLDWSYLANPAGDDVTDFTAFFIDYLKTDAVEAEKGSKTGPLTSALEVLRDMRDPIRQIVENELLADDQYLDFFLRWFNPLNDFLSIGPPAIRIQQLQALVKAGIVTLLPPGMTVTGDHGFFDTSSTTQPDQVYHGTALIEARVPAVNAPTARNPLLQQLLTDKYASLYELQLQTEKRFQSGAIAVDRQTNQLLDPSGHMQRGLYFWGVPTEGVHWLTTASPRPYVNDVSLKTADTMVENMWQEFGDRV